MRNNILFQGLSIFENLRPKKQDAPFIVINSDKRNGLYVKKLARLIADYDLTAKYGDDDIAQLGALDAIVFDAKRGFDYYFLSTSEMLANADKFEVAYDLIEDFKKIEWRLKETFGDTKPKVTTGTVDRAIIITAKQLQPQPVITFQPIRRYVSGIATIEEARPVVSTVKAEKITIFDNWVKIGFNQFDIYVDLFGNEFIAHPTEGKLFIKVDRHGRKYLTA